MPETMGSAAATGLRSLSWASLGRFFQEPGIGRGDRRKPLGFKRDLDIASATEEPVEPRKSRFC
jgi:hypothetical protein